jgi:hypothetical protein
MEQEDKSKWGNQASDPGRQSSRVRPAGAEQEEPRPRGGWGSGVLCLRCGAGHSQPLSRHTSSRAGKRMPKREAWEKRAGLGVVGALVLCSCNAWSKLSFKEWCRIVGLVRYFLLYAIFSKTVYCKHFGGPFVSLGEMNYGKKRRWFFSVFWFSLIFS